MTTERLGRFDHHPNPAIDYCCEVDALEGMKWDVAAGLDTHEAYRQRLTRALDFNVGGKATERTHEWRDVPFVQNPALLFPMQKARH